MKRLRRRDLGGSAGPPAAERPEALARQLAEAEVERDRTAAEAESFAATLEERLRELDGGEALGEIAGDAAARLRGDLLAERDAKTAEADRAGRAADYIQHRLHGAAEAAATALKAQPISLFRAAEAERQAAAAILAARERDVAEARARFAEADAAGEAIRERYILSARDAKERRAREHAERIRWGLSQPDTYLRGLYGDRFRRAGARRPRRAQRWSPRA